MCFEWTNSFTVADLHTIVLLSSARSISCCGKCSAVSAVLHQVYNNIIRCSFVIVRNIVGLNICSEDDVILNRYKH